MSYVVDCYTGNLHFRMSELPSLPVISELNSQEYDAFKSSINVLFEPAPPLVNILYSLRPFDSHESLISTATKILLDENGPLTEQQKLEVINAHPRLGENKNNLSAMSLQEQGYTRVDKNDEPDSSTIKPNGDADVNKKLQELNAVYEEKFGFKFVIFVNGRTRREIVPILEEKIENGNKRDELRRGLMDMMNIASDRLKKLHK
ncbi:17516_t:CDS:1 [Acaulospora morrowiae]|uniref:17516_t:CDS:1 n=1 Tax=Acaulospora morrowiae TaxID=94023 RepID=A0A9N8VQA9_9GLOM|nr:17516_t:CDS:1 [Acaulospora morrowiae]